GSNWSALGSGFADNVLAMAVSGSDLYLAGYYFSTADFSTVNYIAKWNGSSWSAVGSDLYDYSMSALAVSGSDLYVGGDSGIAKWNESGWSWLGSGIGGYVYALAEKGKGVGDAY